MCILSDRCNTSTPPAKAKKQRLKQNPWTRAKCHPKIANISVQTTGFVSHLSTSLQQFVQVRKHQHCFLCAHRAVWCKESAWNCHCSCAAFCFRLCVHRAHCGTQSCGHLRGSQWERLKVHLLDTSSDSSGWFWNCWNRNYTLMFICFLTTKRQDVERIRGQSPFIVFVLAHQWLMVSWARLAGKMFASKKI